MYSVVEEETKFVNNNFLWSEI